MCSQNHTGPGIPKGSKSRFTTDYKPGQGKKKKRFCKRNKLSFFILLFFFVRTGPTFHFHPCNLQGENITQYSDLARY